LRLLAADTSVEGTYAYRTAVNVPHTWQSAPMGVGMYRIQGGDADLSELFFRTGVRIAHEQMPPLATVEVDDTGQSILRSWIEALPPPQ
jgi:hypothetical protein